MTAAAKIFLAWLLDLVLGEPAAAWHPVCWMGWMVDLADRTAPGRKRLPAIQRISGAAVAVALPAGTYLVARWFIRSLPRPMSAAVEVALISVALAPRSLYEHASRVESRAAAGIDEAREAVSHMVGRDTGGLDEHGVVSAAVESVAENANDGVIAPLFYGVIGGAPLALAYKMVNTLDSMIGYRDERYLHFGWAAARLDDAAGFIPARLTALAASAASPLVGGSPREALATCHVDAGRHDSPNAGICEAAYAGALGVQLGGISSYSGRQVNKPLLGRKYSKPDFKDIGRAARLMYASAFLVMSAGTLTRAMIPIPAGRIFKWGGSL